MSNRLMTSRTFGVTSVLLALTCGLIGCNSTPANSPRADPPVQAAAAAAPEAAPAAEALQTVIWDAGIPYCPYCRQRVARESTACAKCSHDYIWQAEYGSETDTEELKKRFAGTWGTAWAYGGVGNNVKPPGIQINLDRRGNVWDDGVDANIGTWRVVSDDTIEITAETSRWPVNPLKCTLRGGLLYTNTQFIDHFARQ